jgi:7-alpha-hydroxysteroid dehydrogenase
MSISIAGKTAIVTGAAEGIGLAIARHFLDKDANVVVADPDEEKLRDEWASEADGEGPVRIFAGDLCQKLTVNNLLSLTYDAFERVDVLVNASRRMVTSDPLDATEDAVDFLWRENVLTSLRLSQLTARRMIQQAERAGEEIDGRSIGAIINLSSIAAHHTRPELLGYSMASAAVDQMTRSLAVALAGKGIRVNAVAFGSVMSASLHAALKDHPEYRQAITEGTPLHRIAAPAELAETVQFLASDAAGFITGQIITIDGGRSLIDPVVAPAH